MTTTGPTSRPVRRILVMGSSVGYYVRPPAGGGTTFAEQLEQRLADGGTHVEVRNASRWYESLPEGFRRTPDLLAWHRPDVVVLAYGYIESQPWVAPRWFTKWLFTWRPSTSVTGQALRRRLEPVARRSFLRLAPPIARHPRVPSRVPPRRVRAELGRLLSLIEHERGARVLCLTVPPTTERVESVLPTTSRRIEATNRAIVQAVEAGPGAELVDLGAIVGAHGHEEVLPDGIHLSARGHALVADELLRRLS